MVVLNIQFQYLRTQPLADASDITLQQLLDSSPHHPKSIFRNPNDMILATIDCMRRFSVFAHAPNSQPFPGKAIRT